MNTWVEKDCVIEHNGRRFEAGGACLSDNQTIGYLGKNGILTDWHGNQIGTYRISATWNTPSSYVSSTMHQVEAIVNGVVYAGRSAGVGMLYRGKRKAKQPGETA